MRLARLTALLVAGWVAYAAPVGAAAWEHRLWLVDETPDETTITALTAAGVDGFVVPVGSARISTGATTFTARGHPPLTALGAVPSSIAVWVEGEGDARGDAASFWGQIAPLARSLGGDASLVLIAVRSWPGLPGFAAAVAREAGLPVAVMLSATELAEVVPRGGWEGLGVVAVACGRPRMLGFTPTDIDDDLDALHRLDDLGLSYRVAIVIMPRVAPEPGAGRLGLRPLLNPQLAAHRGPGNGIFTLRRALDWGGKALSAGTTVELDVTTTARYARDLGLILRPVHGGLTGWDTVALPPREPTPGISQEALLDFLRGGSPFPRPRVNTRWLSPTRLEVAILNPGPHATGFGAGRNFVEVSFSGASLLDLRLGDFTMMEYGELTGGRWRSVDAPRRATAVRLDLVFIPPRELLGGAVISFLGRPFNVRTRWGVLPGDGTATVGPFEPVRRPVR